jgi:hypothetical protein
VALCCKAINLLRKWKGEVGCKLLLNKRNIVETVIGEIKRLTNIVSTRLHKHIKFYSYISDEDKIHDGVKSEVGIKSISKQKHSIICLILKFCK